MGKYLAACKRHLRLVVQLGFTALTNGYAAGFTQGKIYSGNTKAFCVPGLNCYSCPGALGSCPLGALQAVLGNRSHHISFYVLGILMMIGALGGRFICGWLCPFGLVQDLLHKLPFVRKLKKLPGDRGLKYLKYGLLIGFVIVLPLTVVDLIGQGKPWFCEYICPAGTLLAGLPLLALNDSLRAVVGGLFYWKLALLIVIVLLSIAVYRPFCRYLCPLGAIYGLFNRFALYRFTVDVDKCNACGACQRSCPLDIPTFQTPNSTECIRCGICLKSCPKDALHPARYRAIQNQSIHQEGDTKE